MTPIAATDLSEVLKEKPPGKPVNGHVVHQGKEPEPDFAKMKREIEGAPLRPPIKEPGSSVE